MINKIHVLGIQDHKTKENIFQKRDSTCYMKYQFCWQVKGYISSWLAMCPICLLSPTLGRFSQCLHDVSSDYRASNQIVISKQHENNMMWCGNCNLNGQ